VEPAVVDAVGVAEPGAFAVAAGEVDPAADIVAAAVGIAEAVVDLVAGTVFGFGLRAVHFGAGIADKLAVVHSAEPVNWTKSSIQETK
jgi:hypothetical protein